MEWNNKRNIWVNNLVQDLKAFAKDPATFAAQYGKHTGKCCFCDIRLTDDRDGSSVEVGYGPVCAKKWNLPHLLNKVSPDIREMMLNEDIPLQNRGGATKPKKDERAERIKSNLAQYYGSENAYKHSIIRGMPPAFLYTDGVRYLAEECGAYWLLDAIASYQPKCKKHPQMRDFQIWELFKNTDNTAQLVGSWDTNKVVITQEIEYTDFPLQAIKLYLRDDILMLPQEY